MLESSLDQMEFHNSINVRWKAIWDKENKVYNFMNLDTNDFNKSQYTFETLKKEIFKKEFKPIVKHHTFCICCGHVR